MKVLETKRLVLRWFTPDDAAFIYELLNEPGWKRFIGDRGVDSVDTAARYIEMVPITSYRENGFGLYAVDLKVEGTTIGMCGLIRREALEDVDIGFALLARYEGHGFAREAARATLEHARGELGLRRVLAITTFDNERSARVLESLGMRFERPVQLAEGAETLRLYSVEFAGGDSPVETPPSG